LFQSATEPSKIIFDLEKRVVPFLRSLGVTRIGCVGFCFGGHVAFLASQMDSFSCGIAAHSSLKAMKMHGSSEVKAALAVKCPQMILQAGNDPENTKPGGEVHQALSSLPFGASCVVEEFPDMLHGWMTRGDLTQENVVRDVGLGMARIMAFLEDHLPLY
jgi:dienelactone hydrolase